ncbi:MAG: DUF6986 family protein [Candidatus Acidiferrales bacterium]
MKTSLAQSAAKQITLRLDESSAAFVRRYPGESGRRQPVHTVYGGAHLFRAETAARLGQLARRALEEYGGDAIAFARAIGLPGSDHLPKASAQAKTLGRRFAADPERLRKENREAWLAFTVYARMREKLEREPVEDFRIDFEDGYGNRPDTPDKGC